MCRLMTVPGDMLERINHCFEKLRLVLPGFYMQIDFRQMISFK